jgi:hypothetical protein
MSESGTSVPWSKIAIGAGIVGVVALIVWAIIEAMKKSKPTPTTGSTMAMSSGPYSHTSPTNYSVLPSYAQSDDLTPQLATEKDGNSLFDMNGRPATGAQPIEADYSSGSGLRQAAPDEQWAPIDAMSSNDALSLANPDHAKWFSQALLPNADLSCANDGMLTPGPTFEELSIYTPNSLEATVASRWFQEPPSLRRNRGSDIRPFPMITSSAGSRENLTWSVSSTQQSDLALDNAARTRAFCV